MKFSVSSHLIDRPNLLLTPTFLLGLFFCQILDGQDKQAIEKRGGEKRGGEKQAAVQLFNGKDLKGLKVLEKNYFEDHGKVEVREGELILAKGMPATGISVDPGIHKELRRMNYEVRITAKRVEGSDFFCGLTFPVNESWCTLVMGGWGGGAIGLSNVDTLSAIENETSGFHEFKDNQWYDIRLVVAEKSLKATLRETGSEKEKVLFDIDPSAHQFAIWWEQEPVRPLGIATWNTTAAIRKFEIRNLAVKKEE